MSEFEKLLNEYKNDRKEAEEKLIKWASTASDEEVALAYKSMNPLALVAPDDMVGRDSSEVPTVSLSYTNYTQEWAQGYTQCAMVAYLFRSLSEYKVPADVPAISIQDYKDGKIVTPPSLDAQQQQKWDATLAEMKDKVAIYDFLKHVFDYNPDQHVRSCVRSNTKDEERKLPNTIAMKRAVSHANSERKEVVRETAAKETDLNYTPANPTEEAVYNTIPSQDYFSRFNRYIQEHHEQLIEVTRTIHGLPLDVDFSVIVYDSHKTRAEADDFKRKFGGDAVASIINIDKNRWALLGPYATNRARVDYFNKHTEILRQMVDKRAEDEVIATDIMKKQIKIKKRQNVLEAGEDHPDFKAWLKNNKPDIALMGGQHITDDCPPDMVEVGVVDISDGGLKMSQDVIYNPVEKPK